MKTPRQFSHSPIYIDERRQRLEEIEQRARRELGLETSDSYRHNNIKELFSNSQRRTHLQHDTIWSMLPQQTKRLSTPKLLLCIVLLLLIWIFLL